MLNALNVIQKNSPSTASSLGNVYLTPYITGTNFTIQAFPGLLIMSLAPRNPSHLSRLIMPQNASLLQLHTFELLQ
jgi:hypothetical protein